MVSRSQDPVSSRGGRCVIEPYQEHFIDLLDEYDVIRFGEFTLKSGRKSPYFINAGELKTGAAIRGLGRAYAARIRSSNIACELVFGPSYKGVPLAVGTALALAEGGRDVGFSFDRKEAKDHGEGGLFVGTQPKDGQHVVVVDDVITSGASIRHSAKLLNEAADVRLTCVVVAVDRQERGKEKSTLVELEEELDVPVLPIVTIRDVVDHLGKRGKLTASERNAIAGYLDRHTAASP